MWVDSRNATRDRAATRHVRGSKEPASGCPGVRVSRKGWSGVNFLMLNLNHTRRC